LQNTGQRNLLIPSMSPVTRSSSEFREVSVTGSIIILPKISDSFCLDIRVC